MSVNFASLALQAGPGHLGNGLGHLWPAEPSCDEAAGRPHPRVVYRVQRPENRLPVLERYQRAEHPVETSPSSVASLTAWVVICNVGELVISATSGQDRWAAAIAEKSTGCASAMAARMGRSGVASPSSGQSSAAGVGEGR